MTTRPDSNSYFECIKCGGCAVIKLSIEKKLLIIRLYLEGHPYSEIAAKAGVSTGAITNIVEELKAGKLPGIEDVSGQLDALRELSVGLYKAHITAVQAAVGLIVLNRLADLGVEPKDIDKVASLCHDLTSGESDPKTFMKAALALEEVRKQTGLAPDELEKKVKGLQEAASQLEPLATKAKETEIEVDELAAQKQQLSQTVSALSQQQDSLKKDIALKVQHVDALAAQAADLEEKAHAADVQLAGAREDLKTLAQIGLSADALAVLTHEIKGIASHHGISPAELSKRLFEELLKLDKALDLEEAIKDKQGELLKVKKAISDARKEKAAIKAANDKLLEEQSRLEAVAEELSQHITGDLEAIDAGAKETMAHLKETLAAGMLEGLEQVGALKDKALELGTEMGKLENLIESTEWLAVLDALVKGKDSASPSQLRVIALSVTRAISAWLEAKYKDDPHTSLVRTLMSNAVLELEHWVP
jgi:predicted  nucleic acid-binding Zn-ribbon protein